MRVGAFGTFVVSWSQTVLDGLRGGPVAGLEAGVTWRWSGTAVQVEAADGDRVHVGHDELQARAAAAVRRMLGHALPPGRGQQCESFSDTSLTNSFVITDGQRSWEAVLIEVPEVARPLLMFNGGLPPSETDLWIARGPTTGEGTFNRFTDTPTGVICFTRGTFLRTPDGDRPVEDLREGDLIDTMDTGPQEIVWIGRRRMTGARLYAMPELRPVRIQAGALGGRDPREDLIVSPRHKVLLRGAFAQSLFNESEVLVAVEDLLNDRSIARDYNLAAVEYVHLLLPRHHVVWANGVETESFHPASTNLGTVEPVQRDRLAQIVPGIEADPYLYGAPARRALSRSEAVLLNHNAALMF